MKLFLIILCLFIATPLIFTKFFPLEQLKIKNYLKNKSVYVEIASSNRKFAFPSFVSRISRGILLELSDVSLVQNDKTRFLKRATIRHLEQGKFQAMLDFRLVNFCKFSNVSPGQNADHLSLAFQMTNRGTKRTKVFDVKITFDTQVRKDELLVNDVKEFKDILDQLRNQCLTRKNQLKSRRDWFIQKADQVYEHVKTMRNSEHLQEKFLGPTNPLNIDNRIKLALAKHATIAKAYKTLKKKANKLASDISYLQSLAVQAQKNRDDAERDATHAKRELNQAKLQLDLAKTDFNENKNKLVDTVPEASGLINEAYKKGDQKDHQEELLKLKSNV